VDAAQANGGSLAVLVGRRQKVPRDILPVLQEKKNCLRSSEGSSYVCSVATERQLASHRDLGEGSMSIRLKVVS
jgi:hypothetical protein